MQSFELCGVYLLVRKFYARYDLEALVFSLIQLFELSAEQRDSRCYSHLNEYYATLTAY